MKLNKVILTGILSLGVIMTNVTSAFATTSVNIEIKPTTVNVTVPTSMAIVFNEDGTNTTPTNFTVTNNSKIGGVSLTKIDVDSGNSGWNFSNSATDLKVKPSNTKEIKFSVGKTGTMKMVAPTGDKSAKANASFQLGEISIPSTKNQTLNFEVERTAFKQAEASAKAFDMKLTFEFN